MPQTEGGNVTPGRVRERGDFITPRGNPQAPAQVGVVTQPKQPKERVAPENPAYDPVSGIARRAGMFDMETVNRHPVTVAGLVTSSVSDRALQTLAPRINDAWNYVSMKESIDGEPASTVQMRLSALSQEDPIAAVNALEEYRNLDADQRAALLAVVQSNIGAANTSGTDAIFDTILPGAGTVVKGVLGVADWVLSPGVTAVAAGLDAVGLDAAADVVEEAKFSSMAEHAGNALGFATRVATVPAAATISAWNELQGKETNWANIIPRWGVEEDEPLTQAAFDFFEIDISDPRYQRHRTGANLTAAIVGDVFLGKGLAKLGRLVTLPSGYGGFRTVAQWTDAWGGRRAAARASAIMDNVVADAGERAVALINSTSRPINARLAHNMATAHLAAGGGKAGAKAIRQSLREWMDDIPTDANVAEVTRQLDEVNEKLTRVDPSDELIPDRIEALQTEKLRLQARLDNMSQWEDIYEWPKFYGAKGVVLGEEPATFATRVLDNVFRGQLERLSNVIDDLPYNPVITSRWAPERHVGWAQDNIETLGKFMRRAKVPRDIIRRRVAGYFDITTRQDFYDWMTGVADDIRLSLRREGQLTDDQIMAATRMFDETAVSGSSASRITTTAVVDGQTVRVSRPPITSSTGKPRPSQPNELLTEVSLSNLNNAVEARKFWNRVQNNPKGNRLWKGSVTMNRWATRTFTKVVKPTVLLTSMGPIFSITEFDQMIRGLINGYKPLGIRRRFIAQQRRYAAAGYTKTGHTVLDAFGGTVMALRQRGLALLPGGITGDANIMSRWSRRTNVDPGLQPAEAYGSMFDQVLGDTPDSIWVDTPAHVSRAVNKNQALEVGRGVYNQITHLADDWMARLVAKYGADGAYDVIRARRLTQSQLDEIDELVALWAEDGTDLRTALQRKEEQIVQVTMGDPELRRVIHSHRWETDEAVDTLPASVQKRIEHLQAEIKLAKEAADKASKAGDLRVARQMLARKRKLHRMIGKERRKAVPHMLLEDDRGIINRILDNHENSGTPLPPQYQKQLRRGVMAPDGLLDQSDSLSTRYAELIYKGYRHVGKADIALTRGSMRFQEYNRIYRRLRRMGLSDEAADAMAQARSTFVTKDINYDLAARTTLQKQFANIFWFAPAWQEGLVTWLYKLPKKIGGSMPGSVFIGYALGAKTIEDFIELAEFLGISREVEDADGNTRRVLSIPNPVGFLPGASNMVDMDINSLNIIARGLPGLTNPQLQVGLETAADHLGEPFKTVNEMVNSFSFRVGGVDKATKVYEAIYGEPPPWTIGESRAWQQYIVDRNRDRALMYAFAELTNEGVVAPNPNDFEDRKEYALARDAYWSELDEKADEFHDGINYTTLSSAFLGPRAHVPRNDEYEQWREFLDKHDLRGERDEEDYKLINKYLAKHPESLAFNVSMWDSEASNWPEEEGFEAFENAVTSGDVVMKSYEDFRGTIALQQQWAYHNDAVQQALNRSGLKGWNQMTVRQQLLHQGEYNAATEEAWDNFELFLENDNVANRLYEKYRSERSRIFEKVQQIELDRDELILDGKDPDEIISKMYDRGEDAKYGKSKEEKRDWFKGRVMGKYYEELDEYYDKLDRLERSDNPNAAKLKGQVYDQIRNVLNAQEPVKRGGTTFPLPEAYAFYSKDPDQQERQRVEWALLPPQYLSDFQYQTVYGKKPNTQVQYFMDFERQVMNRFYEGTDKLSYGSLDYESWERWRDNELARGARVIGPAAQDFLKLYKSPPGVRLYRTEIMPQTPAFKWLHDQVALIATRLNAKGLSLRGSSEMAQYQRGQLAGFIDQTRDPDSAYYSETMDEWWDQMARTWAVNHDGELPSNHQLYRETLFGAPEAFAVDYSQEDSVARMVS